MERSKSIRTRQLRQSTKRFCKRSMVYGEQSLTTGQNSSLFLVFFFFSLLLRVNPPLDKDLECYNFVPPNKDPRFQCVVFETITQVDLNPREVTKMSVLVICAQGLKIGRFMGISLTSSIVAVNKQCETDKLVRIKVNVKFESNVNIFPHTKFTVH